MRVQAFRLEKKLVRGFVRKLDDFVFNRRAVSWTDGLNLPAVHRRAMDILANNTVCFGSGPCDVTRNLRFVMRNPLGAETKRGGIGVTGLHVKLRPIDGAAIEAGRRASFQAASAQA